jgi:hypothetical protein
MVLRKKKNLVSAFNEHRLQVPFHEIITNSPPPNCQYQQLFCGGRWMLNELCVIIEQLSILTLYENPHTVYYFRAMLISNRFKLITMELS